MVSKRDVYPGPLAPSGAEKIRLVDDALKDVEAGRCIPFEDFTDWIHKLGTAEEYSLVEKYLRHWQG